MKKNLTIAILIIASFSLKAQDIHFSQFFNTADQTKPANAGAIEGDFRFSATYRNQWFTIASPYSTVLVSFDNAILKGKKRGSFLGVGIQFYNDIAGKSKLSTSKVDLSLAGNIGLSENFRLSAGLLLG